MGGRRLSVAEVDRWHLQMHKAGVGQAQIRKQNTLLRAALTQTVRCVGDQGIPRSAIAHKV